MNAPLCFFSPRMFKLWVQSDTCIPASQRAHIPCADCQPQYQMRMKRIGLCAHPETCFSVGHDGGVVGYWPS